jgi:hypothetical protein
MNVFDLLLTDDLDLRIERGDLVLGESTEQHLRLLLETEKGDWRQAGYVGVGLRSLLLDDATPGQVQQEIQTQLESDGVKVVRLELSTTGQLRVEGIYKDVPNNA